MNRPTQKTKPTRARTARRLLTRTVGPWYLVRKLGEGTWTEVYQARPTSCTRVDTADYVVKVLKLDCQDEPLAVKLLQREAYIAQHVHHPHLSSILSEHCDSAPRYVVLPHIEGISTSDAITCAGAFKAPQALWITRQIAEALQELHAQGWLHGDVKPANVVVSTNGHATLVDLGLARRIDDDTVFEEAIAGSMAYACPETFNPNVTFSSASDVYSLGTTLYELLTAQVPFTDRDATDLAAAHLIRQAPDPRTVSPFVSRRVSRLIRQMLAKDPLRRPAVEELIDRLVDLEVESFAEQLVA